MMPDRPLCVLVGALGGQGGGLLADWLVAAARHDRFPAQATSIPGVAQRTGATTYYFELFPERSPPRDPVFSLYPAAGDVDLVAALEPTEAGRALSLGFIGPDTVVVSARERIFSTAEKVLAGDGTIAAAPILAALARTGRRLIEIDVHAAARAAGSHPNAILFGAIAETGVLPLGVEACRTAIRETGVSVERNLEGFEAGGRHARDPSTWPPAPTDGALVFEAAPAAFADAVAALPPTVQRLAAHGVARLVDYQDAAYAHLYLRRLEGVVTVDADADRRLSVAVARRLAAWMAFEDVIRVAQLKTRPGRLARIRAEVGAGDGEPFTVTDFLKPGREELEGLLPTAIVRRLPPPRRAEAGKGLAVSLRTSGPAGYLMLRAMASLRPWRRRSARFAREQAVIETWLAAVVAAAPRDYALACEAAEAAVWARGYGDVRRSGLDHLDRLFADWTARLADDPAALYRAVHTSVTAAEGDPDREALS